MPPDRSREADGDPRRPGGGGGLSRVVIVLPIALFPRYRHWQLYGRDGHGRVIDSRYRRAPRLASVEGDIDKFVMTASFVGNGHFCREVITARLFIGLINLTQAYTHACPTNSKALSINQVAASKTRVWQALLRLLSQSFAKRLFLHNRSCRQHLVPRHVLLRRHHRVLDMK